MRAPPPRTARAVPSARARHEIPVGRSRAGAPCGSRGRRRGSPCRFAARTCASGCVPAIFFSRGSPEIFFLNLGLNHMTPMRSFSLKGPFTPPRAQAGTNFGQSDRQAWVTPCVRSGDEAWVTPCVRSGDAVVTQDKRRSSFRLRGQAAVRHTFRSSHPPQRGFARTGQVRHAPRACCRARACSCSRARAANWPRCLRRARCHC